MNKKLKFVAAIIAFFSLSFAVSAEPVSYAFSGFGGGLPSSAKAVATTDDVADITLLRADSDGESHSSAGKIVLYVVGGIVVTALLVAGGIWLYKTTVSCTEDASSNCGSACGDACGDALGSACSDSFSSSSCSSGMSNLFAHGLAAMPVYVP